MITPHQIIEFLKSDSNNDISLAYIHLSGYRDSIGNISNSPLDVSFIMEYNGNLFELKSNIRDELIDIYKDLAKSGYGNKNAMFLADELKKLAHEIESLYDK